VPARAFRARTAGRYRRRRCPHRGERWDLFPILRQLRPYLQSRAQCSTSTIGIGQGYARGVLKSVASVRLATHGRLADYFVGCAKGSDPGKEWETGSVRGFAECGVSLPKAVRHDEGADFSPTSRSSCTSFGRPARSVLEDYKHETPADVAKRLDVWAAFFREKAHILRRGSEEWPAHKILLQIAVEHADDSPLAIGAEGGWPRTDATGFGLRRVPRLPHAQRNPCLRVFEGHTNNVGGALELARGRLLSLVLGQNVTGVDGQSGLCLAVLKGHTDSVCGAMVLPTAPVVVGRMDVLGGQNVAGLGCTQRGLFADIGRACQLR